MRNLEGGRLSFQRNSDQKRAEIDNTIEKPIVPEANKNDDNTEDVESTDNENENGFLGNIYLQKSPYKINNKFVEQIEEQVFQPELLIDALKEFESG